MIVRTRSTSERRRGSALIVTAVMVAGLGTLSLALLSSVGSSHRLDRQVREETASRYIAEAGLSEAYYDLLVGGTGALGQAQQRVEYAGGEYWVEREDLGGGRISLVATAVEGKAASRVQLVLEEDTRSFWSYGAFGDEGLSLSSNAHVDSYDSRLGTWADQAVSGSGSDAYALTNGDVGSNQDVGLDQNATVVGDAVPGPGGTATLLGKAEVTGSTSPAKSKMSMPEIDLPAVASAGPLDVGTNTSLVIPSGDHAFDDFRLGTGSKVLVEGPARVVFQRAELDKNSQLWVDPTDGPVEFYVIDDFVMSSNTLFAATDYSPGNVALYLLSDNVVNPDANVDLDEVDFESNAEFYGTIYAPNAQVEINSNFALFGSLVARKVLLDSWSRVHFDEALLAADDDDDGPPDYGLLAWQELTVSYQDIPK